MKRLILFLIYVGLIAYSSVYLLRSSQLFMDGIGKFQNEQRLAGGLAFAELISQYPYSPFVALARLHMVHQDPGNLVFMDLFYESRTKKDVFETLIGRTPAYYDPYFFVSIAYFLTLSLLALAQRYWTGSMGLSYRGMTARDSFVLMMAVLYYFWVRDALQVDSAVYRLAGSVSPWLNSPMGATLVTAAFSGLMTVLNVLVSVWTFVTFFGSAPKKKE
jgi:hypothetical protein